MLGHGLTSKHLKRNENYYTVRNETGMWTGKLVSGRTENRIGRNTGSGKPGQTGTQGKEKARDKENNGSDTYFTVGE